MIVIYEIRNLINNKIYIGSTQDFKVRKRTHLNKLKKNIHPNPKLQNAYNKYGKENFTFNIIEGNVLDQYKTEQQYLDSLSINKENCYNLCFVADGGGADVMNIPSYVLDLFGNIISSHTGIYAAFKKIEIQYNTHYNTPARMNKQYRIVTKEFYDNNYKIIRSWSCLTKKQEMENRKVLQQNQRNLNAKKKELIITYNNRDIIFKNGSEAAKYLGISRQRVSAIIKKINKNNTYKIRKRFPLL